MNSTVRTFNNLKGGICCDVPDLTILGLKYKGALHIHQEVQAVHQGVQGVHQVQLYTNKSSWKLLLLRSGLSALKKSSN